MAKQQIDGRLWHKAKQLAGTRRGRKVGWKSRKGSQIHPRALIRKRYDELVAKSVQ